MSLSTTRRPLVLLAGMMCDERLFAPQMSALAGSRPLLAPRLTGAGSLAGLAHLVLAGLPDGPCDLAGLSMGGILALEIVRQAPGRVARLALLDTNHRPDSPERRTIRARQMADVRAGHLARIVREELKPTYLASASAGNRTLLDLLVAMALSLGPEAFLEQSQALAGRPDLGEVLAGLAVPVLVLCGAEDRLCPPERHREMAALCPQARLVIVPAAGHIATLEQPAAVNAALAAWLALPSPLD